MRVENVMDATLRPIYEMYGQTRGCYFYRPAVRGIAEVIDCFRPKLIPASIQTPGLQEGLLWMDLSIEHYFIWVCIFRRMESLR